MKGYAFKYEDIDDLSKTERKIILILGDNYKLPPLIIENKGIRIKNKNELYDRFFTDNIRKNEFNHKLVLFLLFFFKISSYFLINRHYFFPILFWSFNISPASPGNKYIPINLIII